MTEVHTLPAPLVPHGWRDVDTSVDNEVPELLSDEQLDHYVDTVVELLRAAGLHVDTDLADPTRLAVRAPVSNLELEVDIRDDRSAEWSLTGGDEVDSGTGALTLATMLARLLAPNPSPNPQRGVPPAEKPGGYPLESSCG